MVCQAQTKNITAHNIRRLTQQVFILSFQPLQAVPR